MPYALRKVFGLAKIKLNFLVEPVRPDDVASPFRLVIKSSIIGLGVLGAAPLRAVGFQTENTDERVLDGSEKLKDEPIIGKTNSRIWLCLLDEVLEGKGPTDAFLQQGWEGHDAATTYVIRLSIDCVNPGEKEPWKNEQVWGIQDGQWIARVSFTKGTIRETARLVYDYEG